MKIDKNIAKLKTKWQKLVRKNIQRLKRGGITKNVLAKAIKAAKKEYQK